MAQYSVLPHTGCPLAQLWWKSQERDSCELTILLQRRLCQAGRLQDVTGKATHGRDRSISWGQQEGSSSKLCWRFSTEGVAVPCGHSAHWPRCTGTHQLSPAAAHPCSTSVSFLVHQPRICRSPHRFSSLVTKCSQQTTNTRLL